MPRRFLSLVLLLLISSSALAQYDHPRKERSQVGARDGRWEGSVILAYQTGLDKSFDGGSEISIDSTNGWGLSFAWNWTDNWNVSYRFLSTSPKYTALVVPQEAEIVPQENQHEISNQSHQIN